VLTPDRPVHEPSTDNTNNHGNKSRTLEQIHHGSGVSAADTFGSTIVVVTIGRIRAHKTCWNQADRIKCFGDHRRRTNNQWQTNGKNIPIGFHISLDLSFIVTIPDRQDKINRQNDKKQIDGGKSPRRGKPNPIATRDIANGQWMTRIRSDQGKLPYYRQTKENVCNGQGQLKTPFIDQSKPEPWHGALKSR
jgi:hypothetical protein